MSSSTHNVVVVGGGCAGIIIAAKLESSLPANYRVILVEKRPFFYHTVGALRAAVEELDIMLSYEKLFKKTGLVVQAEVVGISDQAVKIEPAHAQYGDTIPFSYLVIATGSIWCAPFLNSSIDVIEAKGILAGLRENISNSTSVLIVGGGACGIELAGEIKEKYPAKKVTLLHSQPDLINDKYPPKYRKATKQSLEKIGVELVLDDKLEIAPEQTLGINANTYTTQKGKQINADLVVHTVGARPNVAVASTLDATLVTPQGIRVRPTFQIEHGSINNIFVAGDAAAFSDCKTAYKAAHIHAPIVAHNVIALIKGKSKLKVYDVPVTESTTILSVGKKGGTTLLGGMLFGDFATRTIKSKDLFISSRKKDLNL